MVLFTATWSIFLNTSLPDVYSLQLLIIFPANLYPHSILPAKTIATSDS